MGTLSHVKSRELLWDFMEYCLKNPELRFWQALVNWSSFNYLFGSQQDTLEDALAYGAEKMDDVFYKEDK